MHVAASSGELCMLMLSVTTIFCSITTSQFDWSFPPSPQLIANRFMYERSLAYIYIDSRHPELRKEGRTLVNHLSLARSWMPQVVSEGWSFGYSGKAALQETVSHGPYNTAIFNSERAVIWARTISMYLLWYWAQHTELIVQDCDGMPNYATMCGELGL